MTEGHLAYHERRSIPVGSHMCEECRLSPAPQAGTPGRADAEALIGRLSSVERLTLFGVLVAQIHDIHALAYTFSGEQIAAAESLCEAFAGQPGPLAEVVYLSAVVTAEEIDHPLLTDAQADAGDLLLSVLEDEFGPIHVSPAGSS